MQPRMAWEIMHAGILQPARVQERRVRDECVCDPGWRGADCSDNAIAVLAKQVIKDLEFGSSGFRSLTVNRGSSDDTWDHIRGYTSWTAEERTITRAAVERLLPLNDTLTGYDYKRPSIRASRGNRWARCADNVGLLRTQLGAVIDRHDAVLRFNLAPTAGLEDRVGAKTTVRLINRKSAETLMRQATQKPSRRSSVGPPSLDRSIHVLWRPDTYYLYPKLRQSLPRGLFDLIRSDWVEAQVNNYRTIFERLVLAGALGAAAAGVHRPDPLLGWDAQGPDLLHRPHAHGGALRARERVWL
uniref:beta-galactoside alpha-(2,6)-sialyltransferase n=1 Tax=Tetraselmis sp. GSL018 TaxID=582737 RepID=A0A061S482_9CHLO